MPRLSNTAPPVNDYGMGPIDIEAIHANRRDHAKNYPSDIVGIPSDSAWADSAEYYDDTQPWADGATVSVELSSDAIMKAYPDIDASGLEAVQTQLNYFIDKHSHQPDQSLFREDLDPAKEQQAEAWVRRTRNACRQASDDPLKVADIIADALVAACEPLTIHPALLLLATRMGVLMWYRWHDDPVIPKDEAPSSPLQRQAAVHFNRMRRDWTNDNMSLYFHFRDLAYPPPITRPTIIVTGRHNRDIVQDIIGAMQQPNAPRVYNRSGQLAKETKAPDDTSCIEMLTEDALAGHADRLVDFTQITAKGKRRPAHPPHPAIRDVAACCQDLFPQLDGITSSPLAKPSGALLTQPGYDKEARIIYRPSRRFYMPPVPDDPHPDDVATAKARLDETFIDFPFREPASRTAVYALLLTLIARLLIGGHVPLWRFSARQAGTGKTLLASTIGLIITGVPPALMPPVQSDDEWRKRLTSVLLQGNRYIVFDNIVGRLDSPSLSNALTSHVYEDRQLGVSKVVRVQQQSVFACTGNNLRVSSELLRRIVPINLDAKTARPWQRKGFQHPDLHTWVLSQRPHLLWSLFVLIRHWLKAGRPKASVPALGSFEPWTEVVGGILAHAGIDHFLANLDEEYQFGDEEASEWEEFLSIAHGLICHLPFTVKQLCAALAENDVLRDALPSALMDAWTRRDSFRVKVGNAFADKEGVQFGPFHTKRDGTRQHATLWRVVKRPNHSPQEESGEVR